MPTGYHHLTQNQRCQLYALKSRGDSQNSIAKFLKVAPSTISREIKRNSGGRGYRLKQAQTCAELRRFEASSMPRRMVPELIKRIESDLTDLQCSPEQISGRLGLEGTLISHESIYKHIWKNRQLGGALFKNLRHRGKKYNKRPSKTAGRGCIPNRVDIDKRPKVVDNKNRFGDWEADLIIGAGQQGALLTLVDRKTKYLKVTKLFGKHAEPTAQAIIDALSTLPKMFHKTITFDNGKEFSRHAEISAKLNIDCYFAKPYHSWERGLNEHTNGLIRQYFPKGTNLLEVSEDEISRVEQIINNRPRKVLRYRTPKELLMRAIE